MVGKLAQVNSRWTPARKAALVLAWLRGWNVREMAYGTDLTDSQLIAWRDRFLEGGQAALRIRPPAGERDGARCIRALEGWLRRLAMENERLQALVPEKGRRRTLSGDAPCRHHEMARRRT